MTKIAGSASGSGSESGSICQRHGSGDPDPDPHLNVMDPQHSFWFIAGSGARTLVIIYCFLGLWWRGCGARNWCPDWAALVSQAHCQKYRCRFRCQCYWWVFRTVHRLYWNRCPDWAALVSQAHCQKYRCRVSCQCYWWVFRTLHKLHWIDAQKSSFCQPSALSEIFMPHPLLMLLVSTWNSALYTECPDRAGLFSQAHCQKYWCRVLCKCFGVLLWTVHEIHWVDAQIEQVCSAKRRFVCGSLDQWHFGTDPRLWLMDLDPAPDPAIFVIDL